MRYWVWSATKENWDIVKEKLVWATYNKGATKIVKRGDIFIFYVKGTLCFKGIFRSVSNWYETKEIIWDDEKRENKKKYPYQIDLQPIQLGEANYKVLVPKLKFVEKKHAPQVYIYGTGGGPVNFRRPIDKSDYELILEEMKKTLIPPPKPKSRLKPRSLSHSELKSMLVELGKLLGKHPQSEFASGPYRYDVIWKRVKAGNPTQVFEIQHGGVLDSALAKLKHAHDMWSANLFLVVTKHKDKEKARILLSGSFHEIGDVTILIQPEEIREIYEYKKRFASLEKRLR